MTQSEIVQIENTLGITLPSSYKEAFFDYPFSKIDEVRHHQFFDSAQLVIKENLAHRKSGWFNSPWPKDYFIIGDDGCGNIFFMVSGGEQTVYCADHDGGAHPIDQLDECLYSIDLNDYINECLEFHKEEQQLEQLTREKILNRKWWRFWI